VADLRVHGTTGEVPLERFVEAEARALQPLEAKPSFLAERELVRIVHSDCCVEVEANWYSAPQALIRQRVSVLVRDQQVLTWRLCARSNATGCARTSAAARWSRSPTAPTARAGPR
jgi:hypothetical protein